MMDGPHRKDAMETIASDVIALIQREPVGSILLAIGLVLVTFIISHLVTHGLTPLLNRDNNPLPSSTIIVNVARVALWVASGSLILDVCFGIKANGLVAALGVGGIAISLGFQSTLSNLIGGLMITFTGIVKPDDHIEVGSKTGVVQDVTWRHTTIRDGLGQTVIVPNSQISTAALVHLLPANRVVVPITVSRSVLEAGIAGESSGADSPQGIDELSRLIVNAARAGASKVSPVVDGPRVIFSAITEFGIEGKIILAIRDDSKTSAAADATVRAVADLVG